MRTLATSMVLVSDHLGTAVDSGDFTVIGPEECRLRELCRSVGVAAEAFNDLVLAVSPAHGVEQAIAAASTAVARQVRSCEVAAAALQGVMACTGARAGVVLAGDLDTLG